MRYALISNELVTNIIILDIQHLSDLNLNCDAVISIEESHGVGVGWLYKNNKFENPTEQKD